ncbi:MAG TPA: Holliday junction branch migration protein RuvA, partial [Bacteroidota bacterium]
AGKSPIEVTVDVGGVGYAVSVPLSTSEKLGEIGTAVTLLTHLVVREDALQLFGFLSSEERELFRVLLSVTGIGPKMAQGILSGISVAELRTAIARGNTLSLTAVPGIGRKLADRLVVELRDKIGKLEPTGPPGPGEGASDAYLRSEAVLALISLGYSRVAAERAIRAALQETPSLSGSLEALVKAAIRKAQR